MIEKIILDYLNAHLDVTAHMETPAQRPEAFVVVEKTDSKREDRLTNSVIAVQSYGPTLYEAARLNETVKAVMDGLVDLDDITRVERNTDYNFTDTAMKRYRYQAVFDITHY